eukprot:gene2736-1986_t
MGYWGDFVIFDGIFADFKDAEDAYNVLMVIICVCCAGTAAGLTVGLLSLDETKLEIKVMIGTDEEKRAAESILPIIRQHHLLLVTLLLFNSVANETLPIFLGTLVPNYIAIILSVTLVLIFGEIIPTALFTGANQLLVAAKLTKLVYVLLILFYPVSFPIAKILDYFIGEEDGDGGISREELEALVVLQGADYRRLSRENSLMTPSTPISDQAKRQAKYDSIDNANKALSAVTSDSTIHGHEDSLHDAAASGKSDASASKHDKINALSRYEVSLMTGILKLAKITVKDAMIPMRKVFMISSSTKLDEKSMYDILDSGFSRIPVFKRRDKQWILGYMLVKELIVLNPMDAVMIEDLSLREPLCVKPTMGLMDMLRSFQEGQCHFALVSVDPIRTLECIRNDERPTGTSIPLGIVTMEDILEMIIQSEITDETDSIHTNAYLGKPTTSGDSGKAGGSQPTIFYHSLRRNSHSNLSYATGSYSGYNKTSKGGIRIQQKSLRSKQKQASLERRTRRPTLTSSSANLSSVVEADCAPNQTRVVLDSTHMPSVRRRSVSGATNANSNGNNATGILNASSASSTLLPSPSSQANTLTRARNSSNNFFSDLTTKLMGSLLQDDASSDVYARSTVERPNVIHVNRELQSLILRDLGGPLSGARGGGHSASAGRSPRKSPGAYSDAIREEFSDEDEGDDHEALEVLVGKDGGGGGASSDAAYGFFDAESGDIRRMSKKSPLGGASSSTTSSGRFFQYSAEPSPVHRGHGHVSSVGTSQRTNASDPSVELPLSSSYLQYSGLFPVLDDSLSAMAAAAASSTSPAPVTPTTQASSASLMELTQSSSRMKQHSSFAHSQRSATSRTAVAASSSSPAPSAPAAGATPSASPLHPRTRSPVPAPASAPAPPSMAVPAPQRALLIRDWDSFTF